MFSNFVNKTPQSSRKSPRRRSFTRQTAKPFQRRVFFDLAGILLGSSIIALSFLILADIRISQIRLGYSIFDLEKQLSSLKEERGQLRLEIATLKRPEQIKRKARIKLGLELPAADQIRRLHVKKSRPEPKLP